MKRPIILACLTLLLAACSPTAPATNDSAANASAEEPGPASAPKSPAQDFADRTAALAAFEIAAGNIAKQKAASPAIRALGQRMYDQHVQTTMRLKAAAAKVPGILVDASLTPELTANLATLQKASGAQFDAAFRAQQIALQSKELERMKGYAASGEAEPLKTFAEYNTPWVLNHLRRAKGEAS